jgi:hypothetical protein
VPVQAGLGQSPVKRAFAKAARLKLPAAEQLLRKGSERQIGIFPAQLDQTGDLRRIHRPAMSEVFSGFSLQGSKLAMPVGINPSLYCRRCVHACVPRLLRGMLERPGKGLPGLALLEHRLNGGKARQGARVPGILFAFKGCFHAPPTVPAPFSKRHKLVVWDLPSAHIAHRNSMANRDGSHPD